MYSLVIFGLGVFFGVVLMCLLSINRDELPINVSSKDIVNLALQARAVGAIYSMRLYNMANGILSNKPVDDEVKCPVCGLLYEKCECGLCGNKV